MKHRGEGHAGRRGLEETVHHTGGIRCGEYSRQQLVAELEEVALARGNIGVERRMFWAKRGLVSAVAHTSIKVRQINSWCEIIGVVECRRAHRQIPCVGGVCAAWKSAP